MSLFDFDERFGRVRSPHTTNICVHEHICLYWLWEFFVYNMYVFAKKVNKHIFVRYLESKTDVLQVLNLD
jgi:hypothetical protein